MSVNEVEREEQSLNFILCLGLRLAHLKYSHLD